MGLYFSLLLIININLMLWKVRGVDVVVGGRNMAATLVDWIWRVHVRDRFSLPIKSRISFFSFALVHGY